VVGRGEEPATKSDYSDPPPLLPRAGVESIVGHATARAIAEYAVGALIVFQVFYCQALMKLVLLPSVLLLFQ